MLSKGEAKIGFHWQVIDIYTGSDHNAQYSGIYPPARSMDIQIHSVTHCRLICKIFLSKAFMVDAQKKGS